MNEEKHRMEYPITICEYLKKNHVGKENAIHSKELQRVFSVHGSTLRRKISMLRQCGYPICSDVNGYYYAEKQKEINGTIRRLNSLVTGISNTRTGMLYASVKKPEAITLRISIKLE